jgi:para-nitrobenzyl esterase
MKPTALRALITALIATFCTTHAEARARQTTLPRPVVAVTEGQLRGQALKDGTFTFKAVPFARPPVGDLRWTPPQAPEPWQGVRDAATSAPACLQADYGWNKELSKTSDEDCLYLELRTPSLDPAAKKPVMVFIHGGANRAGAARGTIASDLAGQGVVVVSIAYRLGALGFLSHPSLTAESGNKASGNYALMDQARALQWVRDNIARFGGDPDNVTLFGHSAGAQDVGLLMVSPLGRKLFNKTIMQSGNPQFGFFTRSLKQNEDLGVTLAKKLIPDASINAAGPEGLKVLRMASGKVLQTTADGLDAPIDDDSFIWDQVTVDGYVIREAPEDTFQASRQTRVPMIIGLSASEFDLYGGASAQYETLKTEYGERNMKVLRAYGLDVSQDPPADPVLGSATRQILTDKMFRCPANWLAKLHSQGGALVWLYQLDVYNPSPSNTLNLAVHGSELPFVFGKRPAHVTEAQWPSLGRYWLAFARTGSPNSLKLKDWTAYGDKARYAEFTRDGMVMKTDLRKEICDYRLPKGN